MNLRSRLAIIFFAVAFIPSLLISATVFIKYSKTLEEERFSTLKDLASFKSYQIDAFMSNINSSIALIQGECLLKDTLPVLTDTNIPSDDLMRINAINKISQRLKDIQSMAGLSNIFIVGKDGTILYATQSDPKVYNVNSLCAPAREIFTSSRDKVYFAEQLCDTTGSGKLAQIIGAPLFDYDNNFIGVVILELPMEALYGVIKEPTGLGKTGEVILSRRELGNIRFVCPLRGDDGAVFDKRIAIGDEDAVPAQRAAQGEYGYGYYFDYAHRYVGAAWRYIPSLNIGLVVKMETKEFWGSSIKLGILIILANIFICAIAIISSIFLANTISDARDRLYKEISEHKKTEEVLQKSELKIRGILDNTYQFIGLMDMEGILIDANRSALEFSGIKESDVLGKPFWDTPWWEHSKAEQEKLRQAVDKVRAGGFARFETTHVAKDGATHIVDFSLKPVKDKSGKVIFMVPEGRDITESRLADKELLDSQEEYEIVVNNALDGIWWVDMEGDFKQVNDAYCKMSGYSQKELLNMNISDVEHNETKADVKRHIQLIKEAGKLSFETKHRRKDGSVYDLEVNVKYIPMHGGRLIAVIRDITERKDKERIIKEGRARLDLALVSSGMGVWSFDIGRNKRDFDGQTCYLLGIDKEKFSGTPEEFYGVVHPDDRQTIKETLSKAIKENGVYRCEYRVVRPDKSIRHIAARGSVEYDEKARPLRVNGVIWDIAENKRKEEELLESKRLLDSTGSLANVGGWQIYAGSRELTWTEEVYRIHEVASSYIPTIDNGISFYAPESRPVIKNAVESLLERGEPFDLQLKFVTAKGNQRHVRAIGRANKVDGKIVSVYGAFQDITERKKIEEDMALINRKLKHAAEEWRATFDSMTAMISIHDKDYRIVRVNKAFADAFKGKPQDFIGKLCYEVVHKTGSPPDWCPHTRTLETKTPQEMEFFDPELKIHLEVHTSPIFDINGEFIGSVHVAQDISDRKKIEASQRLALLGELVAEMAHEVNNPLMIIAGKAQLYLMKHREDKELADNLKIILDECMRAKEIIHNLLVFSKPSKGEVKEADIKKTLDDIVMLLEHQYKLAGISIVKNYGKDIPGVWIDEKGIQAVAMNLLKNAAESMPQGGTITVSIYTDGGFLKIDFNDTGSGIDPENIAKLFQPFFTTKENGTGLGLPVCYGIIKAHGGEIKVKSDLGIGTTMTIMIPLGGGKA